MSNPNLSETLKAIDGIVSDKVAALRVYDETDRPWELVEATQHHGAYVVNCYGATVCDLYAMSNPMAASVRNGGESYPIPFTDADVNGPLMVRAANAHNALVSALQDADSALCSLGFTAAGEPRSAIAAALALAKGGA